jgi:1-acyl-sn-glycerol-3-phosphate acyltransferase
MIRLWWIARMFIGWLFTLVMSALACVPLLIGKPVWGWLVMLKPWAQGALAIGNIRLAIEGGEHLAGPAVFVSNHQSLAEGVFMPAILPTRTRFVAKKELGRIPFFGWMLAFAGGVMVDRKKPRAAIEAIREAVRSLPKGWSVVVFPEGTRTVDGRLGPFKKGAFHIALETRLPMVPMAMEGAHALIPKGSYLARGGTVYVTVGKPIPTTDWRLETLDQHMDEVWNAVAQCLKRSRQRYALETGRPLREGSAQGDARHGESAMSTHAHAEPRRTNKQQRSSAEAQ